jgi:hypothetical protein
MCGAREIIFFESTHYIYLKYVVGQGNKVEFYALWILLKTTVEK